MTMMRLRLLAVVIAIAFVATSGAAPQAQSDRPSFTAESELVVLHVTVKDNQGRYVAGLPQESFSILEDGRPQTIPFFSSEDAPVTVGLLIDNSGSMYSSRELVLAAVTSFVEHSNPRDEVFALLFNETIRSALSPDMPFTSDLAVLRGALSHAILPRGRTALYDAIDAGQDYLTRGQYERKALVVVSDGGDNASDTTFEQILNRTQASNVVIHGVGLVDPVEQESNPKRLKQLAQASGGVMFRPNNVRQVAEALERVALDIRSAYTLGYAPVDKAAHGFHRIRVAVRAPNGRKVDVRTRAGYVAGPTAKRDANEQ
jgi:Ca-activated chloride channel family protein